MSTDLNSMPTWVIVTAICLGIWSAVWKAFALYKAGKLKQPLWFVVIFILNTAGILEIFYILVFSKMTRPVKKTVEDKNPITEPHIIKSQD